MARMLPDIIVDNHSSGAELSLFNILKNNSKTKNWTVLHSLNLKNSICDGFTEADFVLLIPNKGIYIIEVKGGQIYYRNNKKGGYFISVRRDTKEEKEIYPFEQSNTQKACLKNYLKSKGVGNLYVENCVAFNNICFSYSELSGSKYDKDKILKIGKDDIDVFINNIFDKFYNKSDRLVDENMINRLLPLFRPNIDFSISKSQELKNNLYKIEDYTCEKNSEIFNNLCKHNRALIYGSAGTGKTYLAKKLIEYKLEHNKDYKIAFFSHNILFSNDIANYFKNETRVFCRPFKEFFEEYYLSYYKEIAYKPKKSDFESVKDFEKAIENYYNEITYDNMLRVLYNNPIEKFDVIVIDEAQDIVNPQALIVISLLLKHKMSRGQWYFFGDFSHQLIFDKSVDRFEIEQYMSAMSFNGDDADYKMYKEELKINCRNSKPIIIEINKLLGINNSCPSNANYGEVKYFEPYKDAYEEISKLDSLLDYLINENGISPSKITVLSNSLMSEQSLLEKSNLKLSKYCSDNMFTYFGSGDTNKITCAKIRRYKGLENDIVILIDLFDYKERDSENQNIDILYIGLTRAFSSVYIFETETEKKYRLSKYKR